MPPSAPRCYSDEVAHLLVCALFTVDFTKLRYSGRSQQNTPLIFEVGEAWGETVTES
jgi:hypothetical protein